MGLRFVDDGLGCSDSFWRNGHFGASCSSTTVKQIRGLGTPGFGFGVFGLGFSVWGLGVRVLGSGFGFRVFG